jgi:cellobiose phosphorylase
LESPPLEEHETERYEIPLRSDEKESLYMHCVRAVEYTLNVGFGVHGLPYIGIGDWNDGMNRVGIRGQGETVWGGMFLMLVLSEFLPLCAEMGDERGIRKYASVIRQLATAIESEAWNGQWYRRAWYDDGTPMGEPGDREGEIDLLPQAFAALVNARVRLPGGGKPFDEERVHRAMNAAYERLYDGERGIFALLDPPFGTVTDASVPNPGYIAGYPPGARENGGQYTHAAVWGAMALFAVGEEERGMRVVRALSPLNHMMTDADLQRYQKEPWGLCGDVLRSPGREGEGGWSLYSGSAGWYYRLLLALFGGENYQ